jgi:hypothetical protein
MALIQQTSRNTGSGTGDITGPASSTDNAVVRWDGTTGKIIQNSNAILEDSGAMHAQGFITNRNVNGTMTVGPTESWISPSLEMQPGAVIVLAAGAQLIII